MAARARGAAPGVIATLDRPGLVALGEDLGRCLAPGEVVWLEGELGAGKTTFVQAVARGLGVTEAATSPSYALVHHYDGRRGAVYHVDCFRLRTADQAYDLDWETLLSGDALLVEWPERAAGWAPPPTRRVRLGHTEDPALRLVELE